jgi:hypothetical protein
MTKSEKTRAYLVVAGLAVVATLAVPREKCWASSLPKPAARFIHFFQAAAPAEDRKVGTWERLLYTVIATGSPAAPTKAQTTSSSRRPS